MTFPPADPVGAGAGRAGEETETEEQAGAGHRHHGAGQLRTLRHLPLLLFLLTLPLHQSVPLAPHTRRTTPTPPTIPQTNRRRTEAVYCETGEGFGRDGRGLCALACERVCLSAATCRVWAGVWTLSHTHTWRRASTDSIVSWTLVFVVCSICFFFFPPSFMSFVVVKRRWKPGKELRTWRHEQEGPICDEPMEKGS